MKPTSKTFVSRSDHDSCKTAPIPERTLDMLTKWSESEQITVKL